MYTYKSNLSHKTHKTCILLLFISKLITYALLTQSYMYEHNTYLIHNYVYVEFFLCNLHAWIIITSI